MAKKQHVSETPATAFLKRHGVAYSEHPYAYEAHGGTAVSSRALGVPEHEVIKTLIMQDEAGQPLVVLMHGDATVSTKNLARQIGRKGIAPCAPEVAERHTGYQVGGTSPFGLRKPMPVFVEETVLRLPRLYINGGRRGFLVALPPDCLTGLLQAQAVRCALYEA